MFHLEDSSYALGRDNEGAPAVFVLNAKLFDLPKISQGQLHDKRQPPPKSAILAAVQASKQAQEADNIFYDKHLPASSIFSFSLVTLVEQQRFQRHNLVVVVVQYMGGNQAN